MIKMLSSKTIIDSHIILKFKIMYYGITAKVLGLVEELTIDKPYNINGQSGVSNSLLINQLGSTKKQTIKVLPEAKEKFLKLKIGDSVECSCVIDIDKKSFAMYDVNVLAPSASTTKEQKQK